MLELRRSGLTLIELIATIAIIGLLIGVTLSAVNAARESARRMQCTANLGQFGRALQAYQSSNRFFPPALPALGNNPQNGSTLWYAPHISLLPYIEQSALAAPLNLQQPFVPNLDLPGAPAGPWPGTLLPWTHLAVFRCPSDENAAGSWAGNSYRVCTGPGTSVAPSDLTIDGGLGAFVGLQPQQPAAFTDGLSATIGAAEKLFGSAAPSYSRRLDFWYSGASLLGKLTPDQMAAYCNALTGTPAEYFVYSGATWFFAGYENSWYNHILTPNAPIPDCSKDLMQAGQSPTSGGAFRASSYHPGGVNCMYMDGSVRFTSDGVDLATWRAVSTRAGGEALGVVGN